MSDDQSPQEDPGAIEGEPAPIVEAETQEGQDGEASTFPDPDSVEGAGENPPEGAETPGDGGPGDVHDADGADGVAPEDPAPVEVLPPVGDTAAGKKKDRKKTPGRMTDADLAVIELREIKDAAHEVDSLFSALEEARAETKEAKANEKEIQKRWEAAVVRQQQIIRGEKVMPLFANTPDIGDDEEDEEDDEPKPAKPPKASKGKGKKDRPPGTDPDWESWHDVRLDSIGLPQSVTDKLSTANFDTIGELTKWQRMSPKNTLDKIPGIGEATSEKIADALVAFYKNNPQYTVVPSDDAVADEPAAEPAQEHGSAFPSEDASPIGGFSGEVEPAAESVVMPGDVPEESIPDDVPPPDVEVSEDKPKRKRKPK
jgi:hypothetical protein